MRLCLSYKCKEEREIISDLENLLHKEETLVRELREDLKKLKEENKRLSVALHESTQAYNNAIAGSPVSPCSPGKKGRKKNEEKKEEEAMPMNPLQVFLSAIASANKK